MTPETFKIKTVELRRETKLNAAFDKVTVKYYWDAHGKEVPFENDDGKTVETFKNARAVVESRTVRYDFEYTPSYDCEFWNLTVNDRKINADITSYRISPNGRNLTLHACIGAG